MSGSSVIGALRVNLGLDSAKFESGARRTKSPLAAMKTQFLAVAAVAATLGAAITKMALNGAADIDKAAKSARRLDSSVGGFRALELAAGEAGVSLSTLTDGMQTMDREIARGSKNAIGALGQLGIAAADLDGLDADQKLALISDKVAELGLTSGQASALLQDLGVRNREMVLAILGGGEALRQARADIADYGLAISRVDSDAIEQANDRIGRLGLISKYLGQQLAITIVPALGAMAKGLTDSLREGGLLRGVIDGLVSVLAQFVANLDAVWTITSAVVVAIRDLVVALWDGTNGFWGLGDAIAGILGWIKAVVLFPYRMVLGISNLIKATGSLGGAFDMLKDVAVEAFDRIKRGASLLGESFVGAGMVMKAAFAGAFASILENFAGLTGGIAKGWNALMESLGFQGTAKGIGEELAAKMRADADYLDQASGSFMNSLGSSWRDLAAPLESVQALKDAMTAADVAAADARTTVTDLGIELDNTGNKGAAAAKKTKDGLDDLKQSTSEVKSAMSSAFVGLVTGAKSLSEAVSELLSKFAEMLASKAFDALWGGKDGKGGIGGFIGKIFGFANGTNFAPGGMALVGERGPELVNLPRGSQVVDAGRTRAMMGGTAITYAPQIDARGADVGAVQRLESAMAKAQAEFESRVISTVNMGRKRRMIAS